ncbi:zinc finger protein 426-like [Microplitis mediator]|uniref:zinc finger protein 426-like n=1 Tax=Microplitis mediator TaxID=375433 RepID=UPI002557582C|nr:zinc finger protein 426-like [Microplitis mediator]
MSTPPEIVDITSDDEANGSHAENQDEVVLVYEAVAKKHPGNNVLNSLFALTNQCRSNNNGPSIIPAVQRMKMLSECLILNRIAMQNIQALTNSINSRVTIANQNLRDSNSHNSSLTSTATSITGSACINSTGTSTTASIVSNDNFLPGVDKNKVKLEVLKNNLETINELIEENNSLKEDKDKDKANDVIEELAVKDPENHSTGNDCSEVNLVPVVDNDISKDEKKDLVILNDGASGPSNLLVQVDEVADCSNAGTAHEKNSESVKPVFDESVKSITDESVKPISEPDHTGSNTQLKIDNVFSLNDSHKNSSTEEIDNIQESLKNQPVAEPKDEKPFKLAILFKKRERSPDKNNHDCKECETEFDYSSAINLRIRKQDGERFYKCPRCSYVSTCLRSIKTHVRSHTKEKPYECHECRAKFVSSRDLLKHKYNIHLWRLSDNNDLRCRICKETFQDPRSLAIHFSAHKNGDYYECNICQYKKTKASSLENHMNKHVDNNLFICNDCGKSFQQKGLLREHWRFYHISQLQNKRYKCPQCPYNFVHYECLNRHRNKNH